MKTFTIGFAGGREYDEREHARVVAERFGTEHTEFVVEPKALDLVDRLVWHHDGPFGDSSAIPTYLLSRADAVARDGRAERRRRRRGLRRLPAPLRRRPLGALPALELPGGGRGARPCCPSRPTASTRCASRSASPRPARCLSSSATCAGTATSRAGSCDLLRPELHPRPQQRPRLLASYREPLERAGDRVAAASRVTTLSRLLQLNFETYLLDDLHVKMDRMSMAHALETRSPFLDTAVVEFGASLPDRLRMRLGKGKILLRRAMKDILPASILARGKMGFGAPLGAWFRGELDGLVSERLLHPASPIYEYLRPEPVAALVQPHGDGASRPQPADLGAAHARELAAAGAHLVEYAVTVNPNRGRRGADARTDRAPTTTAVGGRLLLKTRIEDSAPVAPARREGTHVTRAPLLRVERGFRH